MQEMFEASVLTVKHMMLNVGVNTIRPAGMAARTGDPVAQKSAPAPQPAAAPVAETTTDTGWQDPAPAATPEPAPAPEAAAEPAGDAGGAQDILAMIRARQGQ